MNYYKKSEEKFEILRKISKKPQFTQRKLAKELGISLGKLNYCLKELRAKGLVKIPTISIGIIIGISASGTPGGLKIWLQ